MAFNEQEKQILKYGVENGKSREEVEKALVNYRLGIKPPKPETSQVVEPQKKTSRTKETVEDVKETAKAVGGQFKTTTDRLADKYIDPSFTLADKVLATGSETFRMGSRMLGEAVVGIGKVSLSEKDEQKIREIASQVGETAQDSVMVQKTVANVMDKWNNLTPEQKKMWDNIGGFVEGGVDLASLGMANKLLIQPTKNIFKQVARTARGQLDELATGLREGVEQTAETVIREGVEEAVEETPSLISGVVQKGKELGERVPRVAQRLEEGAKEAAERAAKIKESTPAVGEAIKVGVPEKTIDLVAGADTPTIRDMRQMYDVVTSKTDKRPSFVAGEAAAKQYTLIDNQRKQIGQELGEAIRALPDTRVDIREGLNQLDEILQQNKIELIDGKLTDNSFLRTNYTDKEITAIKRLYENARKGIDDGIIDAETIQTKDSLFSKLKREDKAIEGLSNIFVEANGEVVPIYDAFRNIFRSQLDSISPEISRLNQQYAIYRQFVDDMNDTIFKTSKINAKLDPADSAAINLRRIESNALSQPAFQKVVDDMSVIAKSLGYEGSDPAKLLRFALELDAMFPDQIPKATFTGGIRSGIADVISNVMSVGEPTLKDQQKALKAMLEELLQE